MTPSTAHYTIYGVDENGRRWTVETSKPMTLLEAGELALENALDDWKSVFVYRVDDDGQTPPRFVEVTANAANHAFGKWLDQYGMEPEEYQIPDWLDTQLERLCINAEQERRAYIMGERHAFPDIKQDMERAA